MEDLENTGALSTLRVRAPHFLAVIVWVAAVPVITIVILAIRSARIGVDGSADPVALFYVVEVTVIATCMGFLIAHVIQNWASIVVSAGVLLALTSIGEFQNVPSWMSQLNPLAGYVALNGAVPNTPYFVGEVVLTFGIVSLLAAAALFRTIRRDMTFTVLTAVAGVALCFLGGIVIAAQGGDSSRNLPTSETHWIMADSADKGVQLKVLSLYRPVLPQLVHEWGRIADLTRTSNLRFTSLIQDPNPDYGKAPYKTFFRLDLNPESNAIAVDSVDMGFDDISACADGKIPEGSPWWLQGNVIIETWFEGGTTFPSNDRIPGTVALKELHSLASLNLAQAQHWVRAHEQNIRTCAWQRSDFP